MVDASVAEADRLALCVGKHRDVDITSERDTDTTAVDAGSQLGASVQVDDNPILLEGDSRFFRIDVTGGLRVATKVVASVRSIEELRLEGSFQRLGGDADVSGMCGNQSGE
jgi:hypothetical protein